MSHWKQIGAGGDRVVFRVSLPSTQDKTEMFIKNKEALQQTLVHRLLYCLTLNIDTSNIRVQRT